MLAALVPAVLPAWRQVLQACLRCDTTHLPTYKRPDIGLDERLKFLIPALSENSDINQLTALLAEIRKSNNRVLSKELMAAVKGYSNPDIQADFLKTLAVTKAIVPINFLNDL